MTDIDDNICQPSGMYGDRIIIIVNGSNDDIIRRRDKMYDVGFSETVMRPVAVSIITGGSPRQENPSFISPLCINFTISYRTLCLCIVFVNLILSRRVKDLFHRWKKNYST